MANCLTKFADLPQTAQDALREKFLAEARDDFHDMHADMLTSFFDQPEIHIEIDTAAGWHDWLLANLIEP
jgi:hypothetical protein